MTGAVLIRPVGEDEREAWNPLWAGYLAFYKTALTQDVSDLAWIAVSRPGRAGVCARRLCRRPAGGVRPLSVSSLHLGAAPILLSGGSVCRETAWGRGLGRALIEAVYDKARAASASRVYRLTQSNNAQARALYDGVADNLGFIQYRKVL